MDNPQHYQPLSHALHPPLGSSQNRSSYSSTVMYTPPQKSAAVPAPVESSSNREEEEEEEEQDDDDEGLVEEQLNRNDNDNQGSNPSSPPSRTTGLPVSQHQRTAQNQHSGQEPERKRRPGRPRGSKNRKTRSSQLGSKDGQTFYQQSSSSGPPQHPDMNSQNQQYYEFQWRILNLCAEFYGAAEELVKGTPPLVVAQCYQMGPGAKIDPLAMLADAKRVCDTLLANPSQLVANPPPPLYPVIPAMYSTVQPSTSTSITTPATTTTGASSSKPATTAATVITNPQSFVVPLGAQAGYPTPQYPVYATGQYPTTPYYQYPYSHAAYYASQVQPVAPAASGASASTSTSQPPTATTTPATAPAPNSTMTSTSGAWSDDEVEKLKKLAEESKASGTSGEPDWEWVVRHFENKRSRHQVLIKATNLGLKASSTRGVKRRRDNDGTAESPAGVSPVPPPLTAPSTSTTTNAISHATASPSHSQHTSTPTASPALQSQQRPPSSKGPSTNVPATTSSSLPWPMPTVAVNTPSPVIAAPSSGHDQQRTSYYRPRPTPTDSSAKSTSSTQPTSHHYMYTPNGHSGSRVGKDAGK